MKLIREQESSLKSSKSSAVGSKQLTVCSCSNQFEINWLELKKTISYFMREPLDAGK